MPFLYRGNKAQGEGGIPGVFVDGALLVGKEGGAGSLANGAPGQVLSVSDRGRLLWATIPVPELHVAGALLGGVRSSDDSLPNSVAVDAQGHMTVNSLGVERLRVKDSDEWVLDAGTAKR